MRLLLNQHCKIQITKEVVKKAARRDGGLIQLWITREVEFKVTQDILEAAAGNFRAMKLLLTRDQKIVITEKIVNVVARNTDYHGKDSYCWVETRKKIQITHRHH